MKILNYNQDHKFVTDRLGLAYKLKGLIELDGEKYIIYQTGRGESYIEILKNRTNDLIHMNNNIEVDYIEDDNLWQKLNQLAIKHRILP